MTVHIPSLLFAYTKSVSRVLVPGATLREGMAELDRKFPGIRHRVIDEQDQIRTHIKFFVNAEQVRTIDVPLRDTDKVTIAGALSGG